MSDLRVVYNDVGKSNVVLDVVDGRLYRVAIADVGRDCVHFSPCDTDCCQRKQARHYLAITGSPLLLLHYLTFCSFRLLINGLTEERRKRVHRHLCNPQLIFFGFPSLFPSLCVLFILLRFQERHNYNSQPTGNGGDFLSCLLKDVQFSARNYALRSQLRQHCRHSATEAGSASGDESNLHRAVSFTR